MSCVSAGSSCLILHIYFAAVGFIYYPVFVLSSSGCGYIISSKKQTAGEFILTASNATADCAVTFVNEQRLSVNITLDVFNLESSNISSCSENYLAVFSRPQNTNQFFPRLLHRYCVEPEHSIITSLPAVALVLSSRLPQIAEVRGRFQFISEEELLDVSRHDPVCGDEIRTGVFGEISVSTNQSMSDCRWTIRAREGHAVLLRLMQLDVGSKEICVTSYYLGVYDGAPHIDNQPQVQFCGQINQHSIWRRQFISTENIAGLSFSKGRNTTTSFRVEWNEIRLPKDADCNARKESYCKGGKYCLGEDILCRSVPSFCIDKKLRCNRSLNCGLMDNSDEARCDHDRTVLLAIFSSTAVVLIIIISCGLYWRRKKVVEKHTNLVLKQNSEVRGGSSWVPNQLNPPEIRITSDNSMQAAQDADQPSVPTAPIVLTAPTAPLRKTSAPAYLHSSPRSTSSAGSGNRERCKRRTTQPDFNSVAMNFGTSTYR